MWWPEVVKMSRPLAHGPGHAMFLSPWLPSPFTPELEVDGIGRGIFARAPRMG